MKTNHIYLMAVAIIFTATFSACKKDKPTYTVTFNSNGGAEVANQIITGNGKATKPSPDPTKAEYVFGGWYKDNNTFEYKWDFAATITADITLYAKWITAITVIFNSNEGSAVSQITNVPYNTVITEPAAPAKTGYDFGGWFKDNNTFANLWNFGADKVVENTTLYAKWK